MNGNRTLTLMALMLASLLSLGALRAEEPSVEKINELIKNLGIKTKDVVKLTTELGRTGVSPERFLHEVLEVLRSLGYERKAGG